MTTTEPSLAAPSTSAPTTTEPEPPAPATDVATTAPRTTESPVSATTLPTTTVPAPVTLRSLGWSRVPFDEAAFGGDDSLEMLSVIAGGPGFVAVGRAVTGMPPYQEATVWTSTDGIEWSRLPHDPAAFGSERFQGMSDVTLGGPGLVAVGWSARFTDRDSAGFSDRIAGVWTSSDGITWSRVSRDDPAFAGENAPRLNAITAGGPGLVAVGDALSDGDGSAAVMVSPDGVTWERIPHDEEVFGGEGNQTMRAVVAGGPGLVAVGIDDIGLDGDAAVWTSPDGFTWTRVPHDDAVFGGDGSHWINSITVGGPGLVAVGGDNGNGAIWTSRDGIAWSRVPNNSEILGGRNMTDVTAGPTGLVIVGDTFMRRSNNAAVWTSTDGMIWTRVPDDEAVFGGDGSLAMRAVTAGGPGLVAVGGVCCSFNAVVWVFLSAF